MLGMPAFTSTAVLPVTGDVVTARPWVRGYEQAEQEGIVCGPWSHEAVIVWFSGLGKICGEQIGHAVQPILLNKLQVTGQRVTRRPVRAQREIAHAILQSGVRECAPLYQVLCQHTRDRVERRKAS
jgi:hypothetical protein